MRESASTVYELFSTGTPNAVFFIPISLAFCVSYWLDKYNCFVTRYCMRYFSHLLPFLWQTRSFVVLRVYRQPPKYGDDLMQTVTSFLPFGIMAYNFYSWFNGFFYGELEVCVCVCVWLCVIFPVSVAHENHSYRSVFFRTQFQNHYVLVSFINFILSCCFAIFMIFRGFHFNIFTSRYKAMLSYNDTKGSKFSPGMACGRC